LLRFRKDFEVGVSIAKPPEVVELEIFRVFAECVLAFLVLACVSEGTDCAAEGVDEFRLREYVGFDIASLRCSVSL